MAIRVKLGFLEPVMRSSRETKHVSLTPKLMIPTFFLWNIIKNIWKKIWDFGTYFRLGNFTGHFLENICYEGHEFSKIQNVFYNIGVCEMNLAEMNLSFTERLPSDVHGVLRQEAINNWGLQLCHTKPPDMVNWRKQALEVKIADLKHQDIKYEEPFQESYLKERVSFA